MVSLALNKYDIIFSTSSGRAKTLCSFSGIGESFLRLLSSWPLISYARYSFLLRFIVYLAVQNNNNNKKKACYYSVSRAEAATMSQLKNLLIILFAFCIQSFLAVEVFKINKCSVPPQPQHSWSGMQLNINNVIFGYLEKIISLERWNFIIIFFPLFY